VTIWLASILLIVAVGLFVAAPLSDQVLTGRRSARNADSEQREHEYALALQALRELEFDHAMGKLDEGDYHSLKDRLEKRAMAAMSGRGEMMRQRLTEQAVRAAASPQPIMPDSAIAVRFCPACGARNGRGYNFCADCGAALDLPATAAN
jgi:cytochrome c-type biogenesis protein CcmI